MSSDTEAMVQWLCIDADLLESLQAERDAACQLAKGLEADVTDLQCDLNDMKAERDRCAALLDELIDELKPSAKAASYSHDFLQRLDDLVARAEALRS